MRTVPSLVVLILLLAFAASAQDFQNDPDNPIVEKQEPYAYVSAEGEFRITWPGGCGKLRRRNSIPDPEADPFDVVTVSHVSCERHGEEGTGCSVTSIFNQLSVDGGIAGPAEVVDRIEEALEKFGVRVVDQTPIVKELPSGEKIEGLDVRAVDTRNVGEVWLRGLLFNGDIYLVAAWNMAGGVWEDPQYQEFFATFQPGVE